MGVDAAETSWIPRAWSSLALPHRILPLFHLALLLGVGGPWLRARPFSDHILLTETVDKVVVRGLEVGGGPIVGLGVLVALGALLFSVERGLRTGVNLLVFGGTALWTWSVTRNGLKWACYECSETSVLWGSQVTFWTAIAGLLVTLAGVRWRRVVPTLVAEL